MDWEYLTKTSNRSNAIFLALLNMQNKEFSNQRIDANNL